MSYHVNRYDDAYPEDRSVYAVIKAKQKKACLHPSSRCTLCGLMRDELYRTEWRTIERLTEELAVATRKLVRAGLAVE